MKISLLGPVYPYRGGISYFHTLLGETLQRAGHEIQILSFNRQYPSWLYPGKSDKDPDLKTPRLPVSYLLDPLYPWTWQRAIWDILKFQPDFVLFQWWTVFWAPAFFWVARRLRGKCRKIVFLIHNVTPHEPHRFDPWLARAALNQANAYITLNDREKQRLMKLMPEMAKPIVTTPMPAHSFTANTMLTKAQARARLNLPEDHPILLFFGFVRPYKGLAYLVEAFGQLKDHPARPFLAIAGEFWEDPKMYQDQIKQMGIESQVRIENRYVPDEEAGLWFRASDLFIAPYTGGTQSGILRIALEYGLPAIATDAITQEITATEANGLWVIPHADTSALAQAIEQWLAKPTLPSCVYDSEGDWSAMVRVVEQLADMGA